MDDLGTLLNSWPVTAATIAVGPDTRLASGGDTSAVRRIASVTKPITALAVFVAIEEGSVALDDQAGPSGSTVRHLLAHASGLLFDEHRTVTAPGRRRIYSNAGFEQLADHVAAATGIPFAEYLNEAVIQPLELQSTELRGSPAKDMWSTVEDLSRVAHEFMRPRLISTETLAEAASEQFPGLRGTVPGVGSFDPNPWGLGVEIRGEKQPHWTGTENSQVTFGHFGGSGSFLWVDPIASVALVELADRDFGPWALEVWPTLSNEVLRRYAADSA